MTDQTNARLFERMSMEPDVYPEAVVQTASVDTDFQGNIPPQLADYWLRGEGAARVRWCTRGSFRRARRLLARYVSDPAVDIDGLTANLYHRACGRWPGARGNEAAASAEMGDYPDVDDHVMPDAEPVTYTPEMAGSEPEGYQPVFWHGPLAPIDVATGDRRRFAPNALSTRLLPLPFRWQEHARNGHEDAVVVGTLTGYDIAEDGTIMGRGYFLDPAIIPDVRKAMHLVEHGVVGPSVDLEPDMEVEAVDDDGETFDPESGDRPQALITRATIAGATLVPITAFAEARAPKLSDDAFSLHEFCLWPLHPGPCKSTTGRGGSSGKDNAAKKKTVKADKPKADEKPKEPAPKAARAGDTGLDRLLREKFLDDAGPSSAPPDEVGRREAEQERAQESEQRRSDADKARKDRAQRAEQRKAIRDQIRSARERYGRRRSDWPAAVRRRVERLEGGLENMSQTASTMVEFCGCSEKSDAAADTASAALAVAGTCSCDGDGVERERSAGGRFCACAGNQTAAVRMSGWDDLPIASRDRTWDVGDAEQRISAWATDPDGDIDFDKYWAAFLYRDDQATPGTKQQYKFPVADVIDGALTIVPRAVFAAAGRLGSANIPEGARDDIREVIEDLYDQMGDEFDEDMPAPWEDQGAAAAEFCGTCGHTDDEVMDQVAAAYGVFGDIPPYPVEAFKRTADGPTPMTVMEDGSVFGHIAPWDSCNRGVRGKCLPPPKSKTDYAQFHTVPVRTSEGTLRVGKIVMGEGHPDIDGTMQIARVFYDTKNKTVAHGRAHEDKWGIFFSGMLAPEVTPDEAVSFFSMPPSGDWREYRKTRSSELIAAVAVNVPGHPVLNQVASGYFEPDGVGVDDAVATFAALDADQWRQEADELVKAFA